MDTTQDRAVKKTPPERQRRLPEGLLRLACVALAGVSPLAFVADEKLHLPMRWTVPFVVVPAGIMLLVLAGLAKRTGTGHVAKIISIGLITGVLATAAYDGFRLAAYTSGYTHHDEAAGFGARILPAGSTQQSDHMSDARTDTMADKGGGHQTSAPVSGWARLAGYLYHYWNGVCFVVVFLLLFARRPWLALPYMGVLVYGAMVLVMGVHGLGDFLLEETGHLAFGTILVGMTLLAFRAPQALAVGLNQDLAKGVRP